MPEGLVSVGGGQHGVHAAQAAEAVSAEPHRVGDTVGGGQGRAQHRVLQTAGVLQLGEAAGLRVEM